MRKGSDSALLLIAVLMVSVFLPILPASATVETTDDWTLMVYLDGDNNLDPFAYVNIEDMMTVGSTESVNIIVFWDRYNDVANLYKVNAGELLELDDFSLNDEEANMGDSLTLSGFVGYTREQYPANHYALILWDHGDDHCGCCWDEDPGDHLEHWEICEALYGFHLDLLAFDACVEGMIEVVYEYVASGLSIDYVVATEGYVPYEGFPYITMLEALTAYPAPSPYDFSVAMVDCYIDFYESLRPAARLVELASIDMAYVNGIVGTLLDLAGCLKEWLTNGDKNGIHGIISSAKGAGHLGWSEYGWEAYIDLPSFVHVLAKRGVPLAEVLNELLTDALYVKASNALSSAEGLGIFFPGSYASFEHHQQWYGEYYLKMRFASQGWLDFLMAYWGH